MNSKRIVDFFDKKIYKSNKLRVAKSISILHNFFILYMALAFILPKKFMYINLFLFPLVLLHWITNDNYCILTQLEYTLKGEKIPRNTHIDTGSFKLIWTLYLSRTFIVSTFDQI